MAEDLIALGESIDSSAGGGIEESMGIEPQNIDPHAGAAEWLFLPEIVTMVAAQVYPETAQYYSDASNLEFAKKFAAVAEKYGWSGTNLGPEIALCMACMGLAMPIVVAHKKRKASVKSETVVGDGNSE